MKSLLKVTFKTLVTLGTLALLVYFAWTYVVPRLSERDAREHDSKLNEQNRKETYVKRVIDGDTFEIDEKDSNGKYLHVRLLGVDTPEKFDSNKMDRDTERSGKDKQTIRTLGELSSKYAKDMIEGKKVILVPESNYEDKDKYGRLLRYVYLEDGTFFNMKLVEDGYATAYRTFNISKKSDFIKAENKAREQKKGLWGEVNGLQQLDGTQK